MAHGVCPWWLGYLLASPLRRLLQDPRAIVAPHARPGMTVIEPGPGMGFFTIELARLAGPSGRVIAIDVQPQMLKGMMRRARRAGVERSIEPRLVSGDATGMEDIDGTADFVLLFAVAHELPDVARLFATAAHALKPGGRLLLAEPTGHVNEAAFAATVGLAEAAGFRRVDEPRIRRSRTALLARTAGADQTDRRGGYHPA